MGDDSDFLSLEAFLKHVPAIEFPLGKGKRKDGRWWVKFAIDIKHKLAWNVVQELGFVLNYVSATERLPTTFMPMSPPPYLMAGPTSTAAGSSSATIPPSSPATAPSGWKGGSLGRSKMRLNGPIDV